MVEKAAIVSAAIDLFNRSGFSRTSTDDIAALVGITKKTLYRHIGSKELLLLEINLQALDRLTRHEPYTQNNAEERLRQLLRHYINTTTTFRSEYRILLEGRKYLSQNSADLVVKRVSQLELELIDTLQLGAVERRFTLVSQTKSALVSRALLGAVMSFSEWFKPEGPLALSEVIELVTDVFINGLRNLGQVWSPVGPERQIRQPGIQKSASNGAGAAGDAYWERSEVLARILDIATDLFLTQGYDNTGTRELAEAAGLTKSALYYYIPNKETVLYQLNRRLAVNGIEMLRQILSNESDAYEALRQIVVWQCDSVNKNLNLLRALSYEMRFLESSHHSDISSLREDYTELFTSAVAGATSQSVSDARVKVISVALLGTINFMNQWFILDRSASAEIGDRLFRLIWDGLESGLVAWR